MRKVVAIGLVGCLIPGIAISQSSPSPLQLDIEYSDIADRIGLDAISELSADDMFTVTNADDVICLRDGGPMVVGADYVYTQTRSDFEPDDIVLKKLEDGFGILSVGTSRATDTRPAMRLLYEAPECSTLATMSSRAEADMELMPVLSISGVSSMSAFFDAGKQQLENIYVDVPDTIDEATTTQESEPAPEQVAESMPEAEPSEEDASHWEVNEETDEITDQRNVYVISSSQRPHFNEFGQRKDVGLLLRCQRNTTSLYFIHNDYELDDQMRLQYRLDDEPAKSKRLPSSSDNQAAGIWNGSEAIPFIRDLIGHDTLTVRLRGRSDVYDLEYDLTGLEGPVRKIADACNWTL